MCIGMRIDKCTDMRTDVCADMCIGRCGQRHKKALEKHAEKCIVRSCHPLGVGRQASVRSDMAYSAGDFVQGVGYPWM